MLRYVIYTCGCQPLHHSTTARVGMVEWNVCPNVVKGQPLPWTLAFQLQNICSLIYVGRGQPLRHSTTARVGVVKQIIFHILWLLRGQPLHHSTTAMNRSILIVNCLLIGITYVDRGQPLHQSTTVRAGVVWVKCLPICCDFWGVNHSTIQPLPRNLAF